jgi:para-aminobenzoate synthetase
MTQPVSNMAQACQTIAAEIKRRAALQPGPLVLALDGGSGSGKSTLAGLLQSLEGVVVVPLDDFFAANIPASEWETRSVAERARDVFDWQRVRAEALEPLRTGRTARWHPFDFAAGLRADGTYGYCAQAVERAPAPVIILEGAYSASPQLADLVDMAVLVDVAVAERHRRVAAREDAQFLAHWHALWDEVEAYYFGQVRPKASFDLVVEGQ